MDRDALAVYEGSQHVIRWVSPRLVELAGFDPVGMPVREAFPQPEYAETHRRMDRVLVTGVPEDFPLPDTSGNPGVLVIRRRAGGEGVMTGFRAFALPHPGPGAAPEPRVPVLR